jgi:hypothetical protein
MKKKTTKKWKTSVRLGPAGKGRRMGTEIIGGEGYKRTEEKKAIKKHILEEENDKRK